MMRILKVIDGIISKIEKFLVAFSIIVLAVSVFLSVATRSLLNWAWIGTEELSQFLVISITFWGTSWAARENKHIAMTALLEPAPQKIQEISMMIINLMATLFCFFISYIGWEFTRLAYNGGQVSAALMFPVWPVYLTVPIGMFLTGIHYMIHFIRIVGSKKVEEHQNC